MNIDSIQNGIVLDHITAGKAMLVYKYLKLDELDCSVAIIKNATSRKMGRKDILKIDHPDYEILIRFGVPSDDIRAAGNKVLNSPIFSGLDAPVIGEISPKGSKIIKNPDGTIRIVSAEINE